MIGKYVVNTYSEASDRQAKNLLITNGTGLEVKKRVKSDWSPV